MNNQTYHILNGDALREQFPASLQGEIIVFRECLVDGPVDSAEDRDFFEQRADFLSKHYEASKEEYLEDTVPEIQKINHIPVDAEVNLWFEDDLFCQVNAWYAIKRLSTKHKRLHLVRPSVLSQYGFAAFDKTGLMDLFKKKIILDIDERLVMLWKAYASNELTGLSQLGLALKQDYPFIHEAILAHLERQPGKNRKGRPEEVLIQIKKDLGTSDFGPIFREFSNRLPIYGFGDLQVRRLLDEINS